MSDPDPYESAPDWWLEPQLAFPEEMDAETYQRDAIAGAHDSNEPEDDQG